MTEPWGGRGFLFPLHTHRSSVSPWSYAFLRFGGAGGCLEGGNKKEVGVYNNFAVCCAVRLCFLFVLFLFDLVCVCLYVCVVATAVCVCVCVCVCVSE